jgi:hypothetical protein
MLPDRRIVRIIYATAVEPTAAQQLHTTAGVAKLMLRAEALDAALAIVPPQQPREAKGLKARWTPKQEQHQINKVAKLFPRTTNLGGGGMRPISKKAAAGVPGLGKRK